MTSPDPPVNPETDLTTLTRQQLHDYRLELRHALTWPGGEGVNSEADKAAYEEQIEKIKVLLGEDD
jgi:hypothetical protein